MIGGSVLAVFGLITLIGGALLQLATDTASSFDPVAEGRIPNPVAFDADARRYDVLYVGGRSSGSTTDATTTRCEVVLADGRRIELDGGRQAVGTTSANVASIGSFTAVAGPTSVRCDGSRTGGRYVVDEETAAERAAIGVVLAGLGVVVLGAAAIVTGVLWRTPVAAR